MNPLTQARHAVAEALAPLGVRTYPTPPATPTPPCLMVTPTGDKWITQTLAGEGAVRLSVRCAVATAGGNSEATEALDALVWGVLGIVRCEAVPPPTVETLGQTECYVVDVVTTVKVSND